MNQQNVIATAIKMAGVGVKLNTGAEVKAKIESGFVDGDIIPMGADRYIKIEGEKATGYKVNEEGDDTAENSFELAQMPEAQIEQLMAAYIIKNF